MLAKILQTIIFILICLFDPCGALEGDTPVPSQSSYPSSLPLSSCEDEPAPQDDPMVIFLTNRNAALKELKSLQTSIQQGDKEVLQKAKELRRKYKISDKHLGIESHQWPKNPRDVESLPVEQQFEAILQVDPNIRYYVPKKTRQQILDHELSKIPSDDQKSRRKKEFELSPLLALCDFPLTDSQQDGIDNLPEYTKKLKTVKQMLPVLYDLLDLMMKEGKRQSDPDDHDPKRQKIAEASNKEVDDLKTEIKTAETKMKELKRTIKDRYNSIQRLDAKDERN